MGLQRFDNLVTVLLCINICPNERLQYYLHRVVTKKCELNLINSSVFKHLPQN